MKLEETMSVDQHTPNSDTLHLMHPNCNHSHPHNGSNNNNHSNHNHNNNNNNNNFNNNNHTHNHNNHNNNNNNNSNHNNNHNNDNNHYNNNYHHEINNSSDTPNAMSERAGKSLINLGIPSDNVSDFVNDLSQFLTTRVSKFMLSPQVKKENHVSATGKHKPKLQPTNNDRANILVRQAGPGLIMGRIDLVDWATTTHESFHTPAGVTILKNSLLSLINGSMGQRGLLMRQIQAHNVGLRYVDMVIEFSVWLPSTDKNAADSCYADCVKDSMNRLSLKEVQQYFPLFLFGSNEKTNINNSNMSNGNGSVSMVSLPMAAPAAVPDDKGTTDTTSLKDACEMLFCTTKQKKRKGVPYCGTCRKFMEETVKWYCDTHKIHPAKEKEKFVPAVRNERYGCKHPKPGTKAGTCDCKSCHSLRRFDELYPNCVAKLDEFKRRTFMFNDAEAEHTTEKLVHIKRGKLEKEQAKANKVMKIVIPGIALPTWNPPPPSKTTTPNQTTTSTPVKSPNPFDLLALSSPKQPKVKLDMFSSYANNNNNNNSNNNNNNNNDNNGTRGHQTQGGRKNNKRKLMHEAASTPTPPTSSSSQRAYKKGSGAVEIPKMQEDLISILPEYILPSPMPRRDSTTSNATNSFISDDLASPSLDLDADSLYKAMWDEDPISFATMETMAQTSLMNTWSCVLCATWNHRGRNICSTCGSTRQKL